MRLQIYTNEREQAIDLEILQIRTHARGISTNGDGQHRGPSSIDRTVREVVRDPGTGALANLLFTTPDGREGAIYLNSEKVAAIITSWAGVPNIEEPTPEEPTTEELSRAE